MADWADLPKTWILWVYENFPHIAWATDFMTHPRNETEDYQQMRMPSDAAAHVSFVAFKNLFSPQGQGLIPRQMTARSTWNDMERFSEVFTPDRPGMTVIAGAPGSYYFDQALVSIENILEQLGRVMEELQRYYSGEVMPLRRREISVQTEEVDPVRGARYVDREVIELSSDDDDDESSREHAGMRRQRHEEVRPAVRRGFGRRGRPPGSKNKPKPKFGAAGRFDDNPAHHEQMLKRYMEESYQYGHHHQLRR